MTAAESLSPTDFEYMGRASVPGVGISSHGLAYRPETDSFFCLWRAGQDPFNLIEFKLPSTLGTTAKCVIVKDWGPINVNNVLGISGKQLVSMRGLLWDARKGGLWCNYGSFYAVGENLPCLAFVKLNADGTNQVYGPWKVPASVHSDTVKGILIESPCDLLRVTQHRFAAFGVRGSTAQGQSWGTGLVTLAEPPLTLPPMSELTSKRVIHWPMKLVNGFGLSDFPRDSEDKATWIIGNMNVGGTATPVSYEFNTFTPITTYGQLDSLLTMTHVEDSLVYVGSYGVGYCWYGNQGSHDDASEAGVRFNNNLDSLIYPGKKCHSVSIYRGTHAEAYRTKIFIVPVSDVITQMDAGNLKIGPKHTANLSTLGGDVSLQAAEMSQLFYDPLAKRMYGINSSLGGANLPAIHVWKVNR